MTEVLNSSCLYFKKSYIFYFNKLKVLNEIINCPCTWIYVVYTYTTKLLSNNKVNTQSFLGKCCALYDEGLGRVVEDYSKPCSDCSYRYQSDDVVKCRILKIIHFLLQQKLFSQNLINYTPACFSEYQGGWFLYSSSEEVYKRILFPFPCVSVCVSVCKNFSLQFSQ